MTQLNDNYLKKIIANALSISVDEVDEDSNSDNIAEWDSLGHLSILSSLDEQTHKITHTSVMRMRSSICEFAGLRETVKKLGLGESLDIQQSTIVDLWNLLKCNFSYLRKVNFKSFSNYGG